MSRVVSRRFSAAVKDHGLTITMAADMLDMSRPAFSNVVHGHADLSPQLALRVERVFGLEARSLLILQLDELLETERKRKR